MKLNKTSYGHVKVRLLCAEMEALSELKLLTNLDKDIKDLKFYDNLSYIRIDYEQNMIFTMSHKMTKKELQIAEDLLLNLSWLDTGEKIAKAREIAACKKTKK